MKTENTIQQRPVLVTGFQPFGGESVNPAWQAVNALPDQLGSQKIVKLELPVEFGRAGEVLAAAIRANKPAAVLCIGQAGGRSGITVEKVAINLREARIPDNAGAQPLEEPVFADGPTAYFAKLPVKKLVQAIRQAGIPAFVSYTAGTYVCNDIMYTLLYQIDHEFHDLQGGFIHVPYCLEQAVDKPNGTPALAVADITRGLTAAVAALADESESETICMGTEF